MLFLIIQYTDNYFQCNLFDFVLFKGSGNEGLFNIMIENELA